MKFKFRLEKVANYFVQREFAKKLELAKATRELVMVEQQASSLKTENSTLLNQRIEKAALGIEWLKLLMDRIDNNIGSLEELDRKTSQLREVVDLKRRELNAVTARKKALESMKEKKKQDFKTVENRRLQRRLDDTYQILELVKK